jgi:hypothetical protein
MNLTELKITNSYEPIAEADILKLESDFGISLPADYRNFLLKYNGGSVEPYYVFPLHNNPRDNKAILTRFYGMAASSAVAYQDLRGQLIEAGEQYPAEILPIAYDPGGNQLGMVVKGTEIGKIYFWDLDEESIDGELPTYENLYFVANSFTELIENLRFWSDEEEDVTQEPH